LDDGGGLFRECELMRPNPFPMLLLCAACCASVHAAPAVETQSPPACKTAAGLSYCGYGVGHDIHVDQPDLVVAQLRRLSLRLRKDR